MGSEINPALTPEEWAALEFGPFNDGACIENGELVTKTCEPGQWYGEERDKLAALALHGRITWEMVDAVRECAAGAGESNVPAEVRALADATADLLESLLPPREP